MLLTYVSRLEEKHMTLPLCNRILLCVPIYSTVREYIVRCFAVPEIIDPVFAKTSPKRSVCMTENERFGLVFVKTGSINSGTGGEKKDISY